MARKVVGVWSSRIRVALAIALTTGALAGCGGDDDGGGSSTSTGAEASGPRTTTVAAAGTPVAVRTARVVIPEGWTKNEQLATQTTAGQDPDAEASAWTKAGANGEASLAIVVLSVPEKGSEKAAKEQPDEYAAAVKSGFDRTSGLPASASKVREPTTLGGRPAARIEADASQGVVRFLASGRGDESYGITVIGQAADKATVDSTLAELQKTWSWTP